MPILQLAQIRADVKAQPRAEISTDRVHEYAEDMRRGDKFPPLVVFQEGKAERATYWLADGFHRFYAAPAAGLDRFDCYVRPGTLRDAILLSCSANATHGLRRTNDDKRRAVAKLLDDEEWAKWSDSKIARHCAVHHTFVGRVRREAAAFRSSPVSGTGERKFVSRHGTEATMRVQPRPDKPPVNGVMLARHLRDIDRCVAQMPSPSEAVKAFPADQHYLFPLSRIEEIAAWLNEFATAWADNMRAAQ